MIYRVLTTTDHKVIGNLYFATTFGFFLLGGVLALLIRAELVSPGLQVVDNKDQFNQLFTMHGTIMLLLFATPLFAAFTNAVMPLQIGAPDVAFPRLNMFAYWLYLFGGLITVAGFLTPQGAASFGWFAYAPLSDVSYSPGLGGDLWVFGLALAGFGTILGAVNFVTTIICLRAPGMTMFRMPMFTWTALITSIMVLIVFPILAAALFALGGDRRFGMQIFDPENGGPLLWQHLFWFFGHPEVYIIALPFFGIISEVVPVFSRKPLFGYKTMVFATIAIAALSIERLGAPHVRHRAVLLPFFAVMSMLIAVPTGLKFFNWIGTMWGGKISMDTRHALGDGLPRDLPLRGPDRGHHRQPAARLPRLGHATSSSRTSTTSSSAPSCSRCSPASTSGGRSSPAGCSTRRLGKIHFWMLFIGFHMTFLIQHWLGVEGMARRYADYLPGRASPGNIVDASAPSCSGRR